METKTFKQIALDFLNLASKGEARLAFSRYISGGFKHHNVYFKGDTEALMTAMEENAKKTPGKVFEIKRILEDGDLVAVHSHVRQNPNDLGVAVVHIFRFENGRIVELWDIGQTVPSETINENGMF
jgi:predicted SnoaL-like aldol condensation-catalyzing enzyme